MDDVRRSELTRLWGDLAVARDRVAWLPVAARIVRLSRECGALLWVDVPVADGTYARLMGAAGVEFVAPDLPEAVRVAGEQRAAAGRVRRRMS
jgi:hypothetical protein